MKTTPALPTVDVAHSWQPTSLYVHVPFCASRCHYCDFTTFVAPREMMHGYAHHLCLELAQIGALTSAPLKTVFFGGGTPTLLSQDLLQTVLTAVRNNFALHEDCEWTVEANPGTVSPEKLAVLHGAGVNRLSFGAQTFDDRLLMAIGRSHDADTVRSSVRLARDAGFRHLNVDLMFGLPEQSMDDVKNSLSQAIALDVDHVSAYWLKVEPGTPFARWQSAGLLPLPGEDAEADMYEAVCGTLMERGYAHYEVSNFARPDGEARHNLVYWRNEPYLAAGVGAHGYAFGQRYENVKSLVEYGRMVTEGLRPVMDNHHVDAAESMEDTMMLGLRLQEGVGRDRFEQRHGIDMTDVFAGPIQWGLGHGLLEWRHGSLTLTDRAWPIANVVFEKFIE